LQAWATAEPATVFAYSSTSKPPDWPASPAIGPFGPVACVPDVPSGGVMNLKAQTASSPGAREKVLLRKVGLLKVGLNVGLRKVGLRKVGDSTFRRRS
jgi:hypothetical protein